MSVDFGALQCLAKAPSKKYLRKLMEYVVMARSSFRSLDKEELTPVVSNVAEDLELEEA